jgi:hypothetical protein
MCQLLAWRKRCVGRAKRPYLYRIAPHCSRARNRLVTKWVERVEVSHLDERGVFVLQTPERVYVWVGSMCADTDAYLQCARTLIERLQRHEHAAPAVTLIYSGRAEGTPTPHPPPLAHPSSLDTSTTSSAGGGNDSAPSSARGSLNASTVGLHAIPEGSSAESSPSHTPQTPARTIRSSPRFSAANLSAASSTTTSGTSSPVNSTILTAPSSSGSFPPLSSSSSATSVPSSSATSSAPHSPRSPNTTSSPPSSPPNHRTGSQPLFSSSTIPTSASSTSGTSLGNSPSTSATTTPLNLPAGFEVVPTSVPDTPSRIAASPASYRVPLASTGLSAVNEPSSHSVTHTAPSSPLSEDDNDHNENDNSARGSGSGSGSGSGHPPELTMSTSTSEYESPADGFWRILGLSEPLFQLPVPTNDEYDDDYCVEDDEHKQNDEDDDASNNGVDVDSPSAQRALKEEDQDFGALGARPIAEGVETADSRAPSRAGPDQYDTNDEGDDDSPSAIDDGDDDYDTLDSSRHRVTVEPPSTRGRGKKGGFSFPPPSSQNSGNANNDDQEASSAPSPVPRLNFAGILPGSNNSTNNTSSGTGSGLGLKLALPIAGASVNQSPVPMLRGVGVVPQLSFAGLAGFAGSATRDNDNDNDDIHDGSKRRRGGRQNEPEPVSDDDHEVQSPAPTHQEEDDEEDAPSSTHDRTASAPRHSIPRLSALPGLSIPALPFGSSPAQQNTPIPPLAAVNTNNTAITNSTPSSTIVIPPLRTSSLVVEQKEPTLSHSLSSGGHHHRRNSSRSGHGRHGSFGFSPIHHTSAAPSSGSSGRRTGIVRTKKSNPTRPSPDVHPKSVTAIRKAADAAARRTPHPHSTKHSRKFHRFSSLGSC